MFAQDFMLHLISIKGEVSNCKYHTSGHIYFTLKDKAGAMSAVMFAGNAKNMTLRMKDGDQGVVTGSVEVYEKMGTYQIYARQIELDGEGNLYLRFEQLKKELSGISAEESAGQETPHHVVEIPVCYGGSYGEDLKDVAAHAGLTEEEVIKLHSSVDYNIYMLGFLPGFPYLGGLDPKLFTPRLDNPRTKIPEGSVGIGGEQTGIYPLESPGGWRLIGRTPLRPSDPAREQPFLYQAGDYIRFVPITAEEYEAYL